MTTISSTLPVVAVGRAFECVLCGHQEPRSRPVLRAGRELPFDLIGCPNCQLVQQHPRYTPAEIAKLYRGNYYVFEESDAHRWARALQQYVLALLPLEEGRDRRLLEIGCATGHLGAIATARHWRYTGIDISADAVSRASVQFGLDFRAGTLARHRDALHPFDAVFLGDVIEHVLDPKALLAEVRKILAPGGQVIIDTPNWESRWRRVFGQRWLGLNRYHINLFSADSLRRLVGLHGMTASLAGSYTHYRYEAWSARPEIGKWLRWLPSFVRWRVGWWLDNAFSGTKWSELRVHLPGNLEQALREVKITGKFEPLRLESTTGDNLIVIARRPE